MKKVSDRAFKMMQTKCDNKYQALKIKIEELYIKRFRLFENIRFFSLVREHEKFPKLNIKDLNIARQEMLIELVKLNSEIENIVNEMSENHKKKKDYFIRWQENQKTQNEFRKV